MIRRSTSYLLCVDKKALCHGKLLGLKRKQLQRQRCCKSLSNTTPPSTHATFSSLESLHTIPTRDRERGRGDRVRGYRMIWTVQRKWDKMTSTECTTPGRIGRRHTHEAVRLGRPCISRDLPRSGGHPFGIGEVAKSQGLVFKSPWAPTQLGNGRAWPGLAHEKQT